MNDCLVCSECQKETDVKKEDVPEIEWDQWKCSNCDGEFYGQEFINWIADRISPSTSEDSTGRFVLRELVQNADDVEAESIVFRFCENALYVYNNGFGFRSNINNGPGDFDRISRVLAKPKEKEYYTSGNFGSGFQTVYLFTNYPEIHSHGKSFRYDPTIPKKISLDDDKKIPSPYRKNKERKGVVFRFPWRTEENAIVTKNGRTAFEEKQIWKRWDYDTRILLYDQLKEYLHDSLLCCQHLKSIRILWEIDDERVAYQVERDFALNYIGNNNKIGVVKEGSGKGGLQLDDWQYGDSNDFKYLIGSGFVHDVTKKEPSIYTIVTDYDGNLNVELEYGAQFGSLLSYEDYNTFLSEKRAIKKSDIHILLPLFPWQSRVGNYERKAWSYSVVPLPKESGNNFTMTAHLFPKQTREDFELHQEHAKREWLEMVLLSAAKIYLDTYSQYIDIIHDVGLDDQYKQKMLLDYLPEPKLGKWINVSLNDDDVESQIQEDFFVQVFSKKILLYKENWYNPFRYNPNKKGMKSLTGIVVLPRDQNERWLLQRMRKVTFTEEFLDHHRFKELKEFSSYLKYEIMMDDNRFVDVYEKFRQKERKENFVYDGFLDKDFIDKLISHCLLTNRTELMKSIPIIPNKIGVMCKPSELKREPEGGYSILHDVIPSHLSPHPDFDYMVKDFIDSVKDPEDLLKGIKENKHTFESKMDLATKCYEWLDASRMKLPDNITEYPIVLDSKGHLQKINDVFWVPEDHHDIINDILGTLNNDKKLVSKHILSNFEDFICKKLRVKMLDYSIILNIYNTGLKGITNENKELQSIIVEGILLGLENDVWNISDENDCMKLSNLRFLPVNGLLQTPRETCLGSVNDKELNQFLGSIDKHVQHVILNNDDFVDSLSELESGNLNSDLMGWVIDRIDRYANDRTNEKGVCYIDERHHRLISNCLDILTNEQSIGNYFSSIMEKMILPVVFHNSIALATLPRWDQKSGERRLENYEREWPWVMPSKEVLNISAKPIWDSIKFICLHNDFKDAENKLIKEFGLERLIARDGTPRGLMMYYLVPQNESEKSLFFDAAIKEFVQEELSEHDVGRIKKSFLPYLRLYYKDKDHETEIVNTKDKRCLYGSDDIWRIPNDFAFEVDDDLDILGYHNLHTDFSEDNDWSKQALINIGVVNKVEFNKIKDSIEEISTHNRNTEDARKILKMLIMCIEDELGLLNDWNELSDIKWVPTVDGEWNAPEDSLPRLNELEQLVKMPAIDSIIDYTILSDYDRSRILNFTKEQFEHIGFRTQPTIEEYIDVWEYCMQENIEPPSKLFDTIENNIGEWESKIKEGSINLKYFCDGQWVLPSHVVMDQPDSIPGPLRNIFSFTDKHENILKWLRGERGSNDRPSIKVRDALEISSRFSKEDKKTIWDFIVERHAEIDDAIKNDFKDKDIFPYKGEVYAPENILIPSRSGKDLKFRGKLCDIYILDTNRISGEIETLLDLGASELTEVLDDIPRLQTLLIHILNENPKRGTDLWSDFVTLISVFMENEVILPSNWNIIPIENGNDIVFESPEKVVIKDENEIWKLFEHEQRLNFFSGEIFSNDDINVANIVEWLRGCGTNNLNDLLESEEPTQMDAEHIPEFTDRFRRSLQDLRETEINKFEYSDQLKIISLINNLIESSIYSCDDIIRNYSIDMGHIDGGIPIKKKIRKYYYFDRAMGTFFIHKDIEDPIGLMKEMIKVDFNPGFDDIYRMKFWEEAVDSVFNGGYGLTIDAGNDEVRYIPNLESNLGILNEWWGEYYSKNINRLSFPTLDGNFWWSALGIDDQGDESRRDQLLKEQLFNDRKLMFNIFSMATFLGANVGRTHIKNYISLLESKGLSLCQIYDMEEENAMRKMIDDIFKNTDHESLQEKHYPNLRRRFFDILLLRRAMKDEIIGENIIEMLNTHIEDGLSPENFLISGRGYGSKPFMRGFKGMFTGQIYFIIREAVRLGLADKWGHIAFHAPSHVRTLIGDLGGDMPDGGREGLAKMMIEMINGYDNLKMWHDIPFFIYYDEFCRDCKKVNNNSLNDCKMQCHLKW